MINSCIYNRFSLKFCLLIEAYPTHNGPYTSIKVILNVRRGRNKLPFRPNYINMILVTTLQPVAFFLKSMYNLELFLLQEQNIHYKE